jgi:hypothetical protein
LTKEVEKKIIIPKVIGVYQKEGIIIKKSEGIEEAEEEIGKKIFASSNLSLARMLLDIEDDADSSLISVIYDVKLIPEISIIRQYLEDRTGRIALNSFDNLPDFSMKNTATIPMIKDILTECYRRSRADGSTAEFVSRMGEHSKDLSARLRSQMKTYGLTKDEYTYLELVEFDSKKKKSGNKIYKPGSFLSELINLLSNKDK